MNKRELTYILKEMYTICDNLKGEENKIKYNTYIYLLKEFDKLKDKDEFDKLIDLNNIAHKSIILNIAKRNKLCLTDLF